MDYPDPTIYAIPGFILLLALEFYALRGLRTRGRDVLGFEWRDSWASLGMGIGSLLFVSLINFGVFSLASWLWPYRLLDLGDGALGWVAALVGWDFLYYWHHRFEHENRLLWACHVNHHSSRFYNLSTALRQPWTPYLSLFMYPLLALVGVRPWLIMMSGGLNLIYQFWVHTETVDKTPRWFEAVFNTPSHHRVHHGTNLEYLDKNYGGIFIVWDRLFRTFEPERARVVYGLTKNIDSYSLWYIAFHEYMALARDVRAAPDLKEKLNILWRGPGYQPRRAEP